MIAWIKKLFCTHDWQWTDSVELSVAEYDVYTCDKCGAKDWEVADDRLA